MRTLRTFSLASRAGLLVAASMAVAVEGGAAKANESDRIRPLAENPFYWQYKGRPVLLLGGSWQDNLFNHPRGLETHLDLLQAVGGNYVRNVMSHRNQGNVFAFEQSDGKFDLDRWNNEYWDRFANFLRLTGERDIIVQIEVWATWDHYEDHQSLGGWSKHPFNPANNVTYTPEESGLPVRVDYAPGSQPSEHAFFRTVPALDNNRLVLEYQQAFVDKLLSLSLEHPHVLYCMNNETGERPQWGDYWALYVRDKAQQAGKQVQTTDMRRNEHLRADDHRHIYDQPDLYTFLDISQNNAQSGARHGEQIAFVRAHVMDRPRPINNNKIYSIRGGDDEAERRFCRIVFGGCASARFHRPHPLEGEGDHLKSTEWGLGLSPKAQAMIKSLRALTDEMELFVCQPRNDLLSDRGEDETYLLAEPGRQYGLLFIDGGSVRLDLSDAQGRLEARWMNLRRSEWERGETLDGGGTAVLVPPGSGPWALLIQAERP